jgi:hypothetical protein
MHGLAKDIDLGFLNGLEVIQIAIGAYQVIFAFDENVRISIYSQFRYFDGLEDSVWQPEPGSAKVAARAVSLLGATVRTCEGLHDGTLMLVFSNGHRLIIPDSSQEHESYDITRPGQTIVV